MLSRKSFELWLPWGLFLDGDTLELLHTVNGSVAASRQEIRDCIGMILVSVNEFDVRSLEEVRVATADCADIKLRFRPNPGESASGASRLSTAQPTVASKLSTAHPSEALPSQVSELATQSSEQQAVGFLYPTGSTQQRAAAVVIMHPGCAEDGDWESQTAESPPADPRRTDEGSEGPGPGTGGGAARWQELTQFTQLTQVAPPAASNDSEL